MLLMRECSSELGWELGSRLNEIRDLCFFTILGGGNSQCKVIELVVKLENSLIHKSGDCYDLVFLFRDFFIS